MLTTCICHMPIIEVESECWIIDSWYSDTNNPNNPITNYFHVRLKSVVLADTDKHGQPRLKPSLLGSPWQLRPPAFSLNSMVHSFYYYYLIDFYSFSPFPLARALFRQVCPPPPNRVQLKKKGSPRTGRIWAVET